MLSKMLLTPTPQYLHLFMIHDSVIFTGRLTKQVICSLHSGHLEKLLPVRIRRGLGLHKLVMGPVDSRVRQGSFGVKKFLARKVLAHRSLCEFKKKSNLAMTARLCVINNENVTYSNEHKFTCMKVKLFMK